MPNSSCGPWVDDEHLFGPAALDVRTGAEEKAPDKAAAKQRHAVRHAWHAWAKCWTLLHTELGHTHAVLTLQQLRNERAELFKAAADVFVRAHVAAVGTTEGLYLHIIHAHIPAQIRKWGDLRLRQTQGLEHAHKIRKQVGLNASNRKPGQRIKTMMKHKTVWAAILRSEKEDYHVAIAAVKKRALIRRMHRKITRNAVIDENVRLLCAPLTTECS
jgi:hypothetical protein